MFAHAANGTGFFEGLNAMGDDVVKLALLGTCGALIAIAWFGFSAWRRIRQSEHRTRLTAMMLERGMTADQIERVISAGLIGQDAVSKKEEEDDSPAAADPEVRIVKHLAEHYYEADDSQKIVAAARHNGRIDESAVKIIETLSENWEDTDAIVKLLEARRERLSSGNDRPRRAGEANALEETLPAVPHAG